MAIYDYKRYKIRTGRLSGQGLREGDLVRRQEAQEALRPKSVSISGPDTFHYADALTPVAEPPEITLIGTEQNFSAANRRWEYLAASGEWKDAASRDTSFLHTPDFHAWEGREVLTLRYTASHQGKDYAATCTVRKQYDGESAYSVYIETDRGTILQNSIGETTLAAHVMRGAEEVTALIPQERFLWSRQSLDAEGGAASVTQFLMPIATKLENPAPVSILYSYENHR